MKFQNSNIELNIGKFWDSNPYSALQNPVGLPTVLSDQLEYLTNLCEIIKLFGQQRFEPVSTA